ncbi:gp53-like domain-containing protein [Salmonella enterica subsp. enterica serovar Ouakam]
MNRTDAPKKQPVPFGINGSREDLLATTPAGDNQASYDAGFPPVTMILKSAGGLPPKGQDMNQILYELSALSRWASSGALNSFDLAFATAIGGYPKGSLLLGDDGTTIYRSTIDANTNNPNSVPTGWFNLNTAYQPLDATLTAIADLATSANKLAYFTGTDAAALTDITSIGRSVIGQSSIANLLAYLGLGTAATKNIGTGANQVPDMNSFNGYKGGSVTNGWQALPSGLIIQWYTSTHPGDGTTWAYNFPIPFPNAFLGDTAVVAGASNNRSYVNGTASSNTSRSWIVTKDNPSAGGPVSLTSIAFGW